MSNTEKIEQALASAKQPINIDQICRSAFGAIDEKGRNNVRVVLHRLDKAGRLVKLAQTYRLKRKR